MTIMTISVILEETPGEYDFMVRGGSKSAL